MEEENPQNSETQQNLSEVAGTAKKIGQKVGQAVKKVAKAVGKAIKKAAKAVLKLMKNPLFWKILLIVLIVLLCIALIAGIVVLILGIFDYDAYDKENALISAPYGIAGDSFYGARYIYEDKQAAALELEDYYLKPSYEILDDVDNTANLVTYTLSADYKTDETTALVAKDFVNALAQTTNLELVSAAENIQHFGLSSEDWTLVIDSVASTIANNWLGSGKSEADIETAVQNATSGSDYANYSKIYSTYFVWDYILDGKSDTIKNVPKKNYVGYIYMPKKEVMLESISYVFIVDGGYGAEVQIKHKTGSGSIEQIGETQTALVDWYVDDELEKWIEYNDVNRTITTFEAINSGNLTALTTATSVHSLINSGAYSNYFNDTLNDYSSQALLENVKANNYFYLQMSSLQTYNFADYIIEY